MHKTESCHECQHRTHCAMGQLEPVHYAKVRQHLLYQKRLGPGDTLIHPGMEFARLYLVRYGTLKTVVMDGEGDQQIAGLHGSGDILGFDGLENGIHQCDVSALDYSGVCVFRFDHVCQLASEIGRVQQLLFRSLSRVMAQDRHLMLLLGHMDGEQRMAHFLLAFQKMHAPNLAGRSAFNLMMTRQEIGSYLGMTLESVSRNLSKFHRRGWIRLDRRQVEILEPAALTTQLERRRGAPSL